MVPKQNLQVLCAGELTAEDLGTQFIEAFLLPPSIVKEFVIDDIRSRLPSSEQGKHNARLDHAIVQGTTGSFQEPVRNHLKDRKGLLQALPFRRAEQSKHRSYESFDSSREPLCETSHFVQSNCSMTMQPKCKNGCTPF